MTKVRNFGYNEEKCIDEFWETLKELWRKLTSVDISFSKEYIPESSSLLDFNLDSEGPSEKEDSTA